MGAIVGEFRVEELVLDMFPLSSTFRLIPVGTDRGVGVVDGGL